jgi:eukaryotic-like serine/threonine-protein kinase
METARFLVLRDVFDRAMLLPLAERDAFLKRECMNDPQLLAEARELCAAHHAAASRVEDGSAAFRGDGADRLIGPYRIRSQIGEGGMGVVYLAIRDDGTFRKSVAVKVLRRDQATADLVGRFQQERQVLANLDHLNIARILDGGQTPEGLPYYVMEYVEGLPLDKFCDQRKLDLEGRVRIFLQVCGAVDYLHEHLVVHRDLKPSNILVNAEGVPKLLDFGIAKQQVPAANAELTALQGRLMTPGYASPEQFSGTPVTKASDIYTLGIILYLLLTGSLPHSNPDDKLTTEPSAPSSKIREDIQRTPETTSQLRRRISGDLDQVVLKCLRRNPRDRYGSAKELAGDLQSFLDSRPVIARKGPLVERLTRFAGRNRAAVAVCTLILILCGFGAWQAVEAKIQTQRAAALQGRITNLLERLESRNSAGLPASARVEDVRKLREAMARDLGDGSHSLTPEKNALLRRGLKYLEKVKPFAASNPVLAGEVADAYKQAGEIYQPADPRMALVAFSNAADLLTSAAAGDPAAGHWQADRDFLTERIRSLGGTPPAQTSPESTATAVASLPAEGRSKPAISPAAERPAASQDSATAVSGPSIPEELQERIAAVIAKSKVAEESYNGLVGNAQRLGQTINPDIASKYARMRQAVASVQQEAGAGDLEALKENLDIAEVLANRVMKEGGR